jgi:hypothetical protein
MMRIKSRVPPPLIWYISQTIVDVLSLVVNAYVLNQFCGHWSFSDVLNATITMSLNLKNNLEFHLIC